MIKDQPWGYINLMVDYIALLLYWCQSGEAFVGIRFSCLLESGINKLMC